MSKSFIFFFLFLCPSIGLTSDDDDGMNLEEYLTRQSRPQFLQYQEISGLQNFFASLNEPFNPALEIAEGEERGDESTDVPESVPLDIGAIAGDILDRVSRLNLVRRDGVAPHHIDRFANRVITNSLESFDAYSTRSHRAITRRTATNGEYAEICFLLLNELYLYFIRSGHLYVYLMHGINFDHTLTVISRYSNESPLFVENAIVVDPWLGAYFPYLELGNWLNRAGIFSSDLRSYHPRIIVVQGQFDRLLHSLSTFSPDRVDILLNSLSETNYIGQDQPYQPGNYVRNGNIVFF